MNHIMKQFLRILPFVLLLCGIVAGKSVYAQQGVAYDFSSAAPTGQMLYYKITSGNSVCVTHPNNGSQGWYGYAKPVGNLVIPDEVVYDEQTYNVTTIGGNAFGGLPLTSIELPSSLTSIGGYAFEGCSSLTSIEIPSGVTSIGESAFRDCSSLTSVVLPSSLISIGESAFYGCSSLTSIELPSSLTGIGNHAFRGCSSLTSMELPSGVSSIGWYAFSGCSSLTSIEIPSGVTEIEYGAFSGCSSLTSIELSSGVTYIAASAFAGCSRLNPLVVPNTVTEIGENAFAGVPNVIYSGAAIGSPWGANNIAADICDAISIVGDTIAISNENFLWHGASYSSSGDYQYAYTAANGCDSIVTLHLSIKHSIVTTDSQTSCDSYEWHGTTYTESTNEPTYTTTNAAGCDSVVTLDLTVNHSTTGTDVITSEEPIVWIDGNTYGVSDSTASYTIEGGNAAGCDSVVTLHLTINGTTEGIASTLPAEVKVYAAARQVVVEGSEGQTVMLYDLQGRVLAMRRDSYQPVRFDVPAAGVYMVKVADYAAKKVTVMR